MREEDVAPSTRRPQRRSPSSTSSRSSALCALFLAASGAPACDVPVFRYALERWPNDVHTLRLGLAPGAARPAWADDTGDANLWVETAATNPPGRFEIGFARDGTAWLSGAAASPDTLRQACDSPLRRRIAREIVTGAAVVWLVVDGANDASNAAVRALAEGVLREAAKQIELPVAPTYDPNTPDAPPPQIASRVPLEVRFPLIRLSRDAAQENALRAQLRGLAPEAKPDQPVLAAVFGRGRAIVLAGEALDANAVMDLAFFLCGACSCQVKELNPGADLLLAANWTDALASYPTGAVTRLPGGGTYLLGGREAPAARGAAPSGAPVAAPARRAVPRLLLLGVPALLVLAGLIWLFRGKR